MRERFQSRTFEGATEARFCQKWTEQGRRGGVVLGKSFEVGGCSGLVPADPEHIQNHLLWTELDRDCLVGEDFWRLTFVGLFVAIRVEYLTVGMHA